jgi:hypothetical protein
LCARAERRLTGGGYQALETLFVGQVHEDVGEVSVILDDQHHPVAFFDLHPIVSDYCLITKQQGISFECFRRGPRSLGLFSAAPPSNRRRDRPGRHVFTWQEQGEGTAFARHAGHPNFAAQQPGDFAADRKTQTRAAVLATGRAIGLLKCLENDPLLLSRNADSGVAD